ncbi:MAG: hypothetical protein A2293_16730 [Elusimicrobia bacterium RIFOXYB2_FULL_49_7]|nr:MAG: hypothetical protein A2293_16730 [Elusimicrobia bacterium RIFOXYB2_FULL_49_7]
MFPRVVTWVILAFSLVFSLADESGQRSYIGVNIAYPSIENYVPKSNLSLVFFDNFNVEKFDTNWSFSGSRLFTLAEHALKAPMKTRKQLPASASLTCIKAIDLTKTPARLTVDISIPNQNTSITSAIYFMPENASFDENGFPSEFIRFLKRSKIELVEAKSGNNPIHLLWGRNNEVSPGKRSSYTLIVDKKMVTLAINGRSVFCGKHGNTSLKGVRAGLFSATKGVSFAGGNMVFDNVTIESGSGTPFESETQDEIPDSNEEPSPIAP